MEFCGFLIDLLYHFPGSCHKWKYNPMYWWRVSQQWEWGLDCQDYCSDRICSYCRHSYQKVHGWFSTWEKVLWMTQNNSIFVISVQKLEWLWSYSVVTKLYFLPYVFLLYFPFSSLSWPFSFLSFSYPTLQLMERKPTLPHYTVT